MSVHSTYLLEGEFDIKNLVGWELSQNRNSYLQVFSLQEVGIDHVIFCNMLTTPFLIFQWTKWLIFDLCGACFTHQSIDQFLQYTHTCHSYWVRFTKVTWPYVIALIFLWTSPERWGKFWNTNYILPKEGIWIWVLLIVIVIVIVGPVVNHFIVVILVVIATILSYIRGSIVIYFI